MRSQLLFILILILFLYSGQNLLAQPKSDTGPSARVAFFKSLAVPGWGHYYADKTDWTRGKYHLGADMMLIFSFFGLNIHSNNLQQNWYGYALSGAGIDIENRNRTIQLAVGDFNNLAAYNDFQLRTRNWDQLLEDRPENRWNWSTDEARNEYNDIRNRFENIDQQLPALIGLMVVNRVVSAISAYNRAGKISAGDSGTALYFSKYSGSSGLIANLKVSF